MLRDLAASIPEFFIVFAALFLFSGCGSLPDQEKPFSMIAPTDGWIRMDAPPSDSPLMLNQVKDEPYKRDLISAKYKTVWFHRGEDDYLLYLQVHYYEDPDPGCDDAVIEFVRNNGQWNLQDKHFEVCID